MSRRNHGPAGGTPTDWRGEDPNLEWEKSRYADPIASRELILKHLTEAPEPLTALRLAKRLGLNTDVQREALEKRLAAMVRDGQALKSGTPSRRQPRPSASPARYAAVRAAKS